MTLLMMVKAELRLEIIYETSYKCMVNHKISAYNQGVNHGGERQGNSLPLEMDSPPLDNRLTSLAGKSYFPVSANKF